MKTINCQIIKDGNKEALILEFNKKVILANIHKDWGIGKILGITPILTISSYEDFNRKLPACKLDIDFEDVICEYIINYLDESYISQRTHIETFKDKPGNINALLVAVDGCAMVYAPNRNINKLRYLRNYYPEIEFCFNDYSANNWLVSYVSDVNLYNRFLEEIACF